MFDQLKKAFSKEPVPIADQNGEFRIQNGVLTRWNGKGDVCVIPRGVREIGDNAFTNCFRLREVVFPSGLKRIGDYAFFSCSHVEEFLLPEGLESIGRCAFYGCDALTRLVVPKSVRHIEKDAFTCCGNLTDLRIPPKAEPPQFRIRNGVLEEYTACRDYAHVVIPEGVTEIVSCKLNRYTKSVVLPESLRIIGKNAFQNSYKLEEIRIPPKVEKVGEGAFSDCSGLKSMKLPDNLKTLGRNAFHKCNRMESIDLPDGLSEIAYGTFHECKSLREITIPDTVKEIDAYAFRECESLEMVKFPAGLEKIGYHAFCGCRNLKQLQLPQSVTEIGISAFQGCTALTSVVIPEGVTELKDGLFAGCRELTEITIPAGVRSMKRSAFQGCIKLENVICANAEAFELALADTPFWKKKYGTKQTRPRLPLEMVGNHTGQQLRSRGYTFFKPDRDYHIGFPGEDGVVVVSSWCGDDGPDEDGFGREEYYDWWLLDENLDPIPGIKMWHSYSNQDIRANQERWDTMREEAARKVKR